MSSQWRDELALARRFVEAQALPGRVIFCALTGAHLYGFPSPDSDLDLKGAYQLSTRALLGLAPSLDTHDTTEIFDSEIFGRVECDLTLMELSRSLSLLLAGNGNALEQLTSPYQVFPGPEQEQLTALARGAISRQFARHYQGFLKGLRREFTAAARPEVKTLLYGYRVTCTGVHLLEQGEVQADVRALAPGHGYAEQVDALIARKGSAGEHSKLSPEEKAGHLATWDALDARLKAALESSTLPEQAPNQETINDWLVRLRLAGVS